MIPIKTNNRRLPGKNTMLLKGKPLYSYLFQTIKQVRFIDAVYIDSSDEEILDIAQQWGFNIIRRPEEYNSDFITGDELLSRVVDQLDFEIIGLLHVTSPFMSIETIETGFLWLAEDKSLDSVFGVLPRYNRFWFERNPVNHDINNLKRTQDLTPVYEESDAYFVRRSSLQKYGKRVCGKYRLLEMNEIESIDIDTVVDFLVAEALLDAELVKL
jgi:CMP-N-acetylneuraminic acid synthetase